MVLDTLSSESPTVHAHVAVKYWCVHLDCRIDSLPTSTTRSSLIGPSKTFVPTAPRITPDLKLSSSLSATDTTRLPLYHLRRIWVSSSSLRILHVHLCTCFVLVLGERYGGLMFASSFSVVLYSGTCCMWLLFWFEHVCLYHYIPHALRAGCGQHKYHIYH